MKQHRHYRRLPLDSMFAEYVPPPLFTTPVPQCSRTLYLSFVFLRVDFKKYPCKYPVIFLLMSLMWLHDEPIEISQLCCYIFHFIRIIFFWQPVFSSFQCSVLYTCTYSLDENALTGRLNCVQNMTFMWPCIVINFL